MTAAVRSPTLAGPSRVEYDVPDMVFPFSREDLLEEVRFYLVFCGLLVFGTVCWHYHVISVKLANPGIFLGFIRYFKMKKC